MTRFTLSYAPAFSSAWAALPRVVLFNLAAAAVAEITRVQTAMGSTAFRVTKQSHNYSQQEIDLMRRDNA